MTAASDDQPSSLVAYSMELYDFNTALIKRCVLLVTSVKQHSDVVEPQEHTFECI